MKNSPSIGDKMKSTWQIENFSCDHVLIPSNIRGYSKLSYVEQPTMFRYKKGLRSVNIGSKSVEFVGSDSFVTLNHWTR